MSELPKDILPFRSQFFNTQSSASTESSVLAGTEKLKIAALRPLVWMIEDRDVAATAEAARRGRIAMEIEGMSNAEKDASSI